MQRGFRWILAALAIMAPLVVTATAIVQAQEDLHGYRPHYAGHGMYAFGGRGGEHRIGRVTSLADSDAGGWARCASPQGGTLRDCLSIPEGCDGTRENCARYVLIGVSGVVEWGGGELSMTAPYLTLAGQTAPGPGEGTCTGNCSSPGGLTLSCTQYPANTVGPYQGGYAFKARDVVLQHFRSRGCFGSIGYCEVCGGDNKAITNVVLDHVSHGSGGGVLTTTITASTNQFYIPYFLDNVLVIDSHFHEAWNGAAAGGYNAADGSYHTTWLRNAFTNSWGRNPVLGPFQHAVLNNLIYNATDNSDCGGGTSYGWIRTDDAGDGRPGDGNGGSYVLRGNVFLRGPDSGSANKFLAVAKNAMSMSKGVEIFLSHNIGSQFGITGTTGDAQWSGVCFIPNDQLAYTNAANQGNTRLNELPRWYDDYPFAAVVMTDHTPNVIRNAVLQNAGARPLDRDTIDNRILNPTTGQVVTRTGTHMLSRDRQFQLYGDERVLRHATWDVSRFVPTHPGAPGDCGSALEGGQLVPRTRLECALEARARALERPYGGASPALREPQKVRLVADLLARPVPPVAW